MKQRFNHFAIRFPVTVLLGLLLIALHGRVGGLWSVFVPVYDNPWELGKLVYWPLLFSMLLTGRAKSAPWEAATELPPLVLSPLALFLLFWVLTPLDLDSGMSVLLWILVLSAAQLAAALAQGRSNVRLWAVLAAALGVLYILFTIMPPLWGPFLDPADVAAMATIPC